MVPVCLCVCLCLAVYVSERERITDCVCLRGKESGRIKTVCTSGQVAVKKKTLKRLPLPRSFFFFSPFFFNVSSQPTWQTARKLLKLHQQHLIIYLKVSQKAPLGAPGLKIISFHLLKWHILTHFLWSLSFVSWMRGQKALVQSLGLFIISS